MVGPSATSRRCRPCIFVDTVPYPSILGYSVLTHEAIIDAEWVTRSGLFCWNASPTPPPNNCAKLTPIRTGAVSSRTWVTTLSEAGSSSHLTHYVRSGDFVRALFEESKDINDYAWELFLTTSRTFKVIPPRSTGQSRFCIRAYARSMGTE